MIDKCGASELDSKALTRVCHAFGNCHHLHALHTARRSLDDMLSVEAPSTGAEGLLTIMEDFAVSTADPNLHRMPSASMP